MALTLRADITARQTTFDVNGTDAIGEGDVLQVDDEYLLVRGPATADPTRTYQRVSVRERGFGGSEAAAHLAGVALTAANAFSAGGGSGVTVDNTVDPPFNASTIVAAGATESAPDEATLAEGGGTLTHRILSIPLAFDTPGFLVGDGVVVASLASGEVLLDVLVFTTIEWDDGTLEVDVDGNNVLSGTLYGFTPSVFGVHFAHMSLLGLPLPVINDAPASPAFATGAVDITAGANGAEPTTGASTLILVIAVTA